MTEDLNLPSVPAHVAQRGALVQRRLMRLTEVEHRTGRKRSSIYRDMAAGKFPLARKIGVRAVAWYSDDVDRWIAEREVAA